jgi:single-strand DNA-binding protein
MSLNKVILIGNVGKDPDVRYFDSGAAVANFPLATSERGYTLANGTVVPERTEWHNIVVRRDLVPFVEKWYVKVPVYMWKARFVLVIMMTKAA